MPVRNGDTRFGVMTIALHWLTAALVLVALPIGLWLAEAEISLATLKYFAIHKTLGITVLALSVLRILWHRVSSPPEPLTHGVRWQDRLAKWVHRSLYILLVAMPVSGWIASSATGIDTVVFGRWTLPNIAPVSETWETAGFAVHGFLGKLLILCVLLHVAGAAYRAAFLRDGTLRRMLAG